VAKSNAIEIKQDRFLRGRQRRRKVFRFREEMYENGHRGRHGSRSEIALGGEFAAKGNLLLLVY
jgi:hypothetical protein